MNFTYETFQAAVLSGAFRAPENNGSLIRVDRKELEALRNKTGESKLHLDKIKCRMGGESFRKMRGGTALSLKNARLYFPAYRFYAGEFLNDEWLSTVDWHKKFHRDHVIHQPMCAYVGLSILHGRELNATKKTFVPDDGKTLLDRAVDVLMHSSTCKWLRDYFESLGPSRDFKGKNALARHLWKGMFLDAFFLAALYHDIGYPWQFVNAIHEKLGPNSPIENPAAKGAEWLLKEYGDRLVFSPFIGYRAPDRVTPPGWADTLKKLITQGLEKTHGVPGALTLLHLNDVLCGYPANRINPVGRFIIEWAAMAVMAHDIANLYAKVEEVDKKKPGRIKLDIKNPHMRVDFARDPLSFMLTLTDQIQGFERPDAEFSNYFEDVAEMEAKTKATFNVRCKYARLDWDKADRELNIVFGYNNDGDYVMNMTKFLPEAELQYFDPKAGYLDYSATGIKQIRLNAERITP